MKYIILILALCLLTVGVNAQTCQRHECSDDVDGVYGNELMRWDSVSALAACDGCDPSENCYEVGWFEGETVTQIIKRICGSVILNEDDEEVYRPPNTCFNPYAVEEEFFLHYNIVYYYKVRACVGDTCGEWSEDYVEFKGGDYVCFKDCNGQAVCYAGCSSPLPGMPYCEGE